MRVHHIRKAVPVSTTTRPCPVRRLACVASLSGMVLSSVALSLPSYAAGGDRDRDGMPNRWEARHGLDPDVANGDGDKDRDGLRNLKEYRKHADPADEDTDDDGHDDGDEVRDDTAATRVLDADTDDDRVLDGDEDSDRDDLANEDEDDAAESCRGDDDDRDADDVADEDENELGGSVRDDDSDDDGIRDGDEDDDDRLGAIVSFDAVTGDLVIATLAAGHLTFVVTEDTEIEFDSSGSGSGEDGFIGDLVEGQGVVEVEVDDDDDEDDEEDHSEPVLTGRVLEEIELSRG